MEEEFVRSALGLNAERLTDGLVFRKRREWVKALREKEEEIRKFLESHRETQYPEAGYAQWKYLREQAGNVITGPEDVVASAERLEKILKRGRRAYLGKKSWSGWRSPTAHSARSGKRLREQTMRRSSDGTWKGNHSWNTWRRSLCLKRRSKIWTIGRWRSSL